MASEASAAMTVMTVPESAQLLALPATAASRCSLFVSVMKVPKRDINASH